jgi:hypothetical protein
MTAYGTFRKSRDVRYLVAIGGKADMHRAVMNRRERPRADMGAWMSLEMHPCKSKVACINPASRLCAILP